MRYFDRCLTVIVPFSPFVIAWDKSEAFATILMASPLVREASANLPQTGPMYFLSATSMPSFTSSTTMSATPPTIGFFRGSSPSGLPSAVNE